jgi:hypothetical protein
VVVLVEKILLEGVELEVIELLVMDLLLYKEQRYHYIQVIIRSQLEQVEQVDNHNVTLQILEVIQFFQL